MTRLKNCPKTGVERKVEYSNFQHADYLGVKDVGKNVDSIVKAGEQ